MPYIERTDEEIIQAWERFVLRHPCPDENRFSFGDIHSYCGLIAAMRAGDKDVLLVFVEGARRAGREFDRDPVQELDESC